MHRHRSGNNAPEHLTVSVQSSSHVRQGKGMNVRDYFNEMGRILASVQLFEEIKLTAEVLPQGQREIRGRGGHLVHKLGVAWDTWKLGKGALLELQRLNS